MKRGGRRKFWTREEGIAALQDLARVLGRTPTSREMGAGQCPSTQFFIKYFGSISAAHRAAGLASPRGGRKATRGRYAVNAPLIDPSRAAKITADKQEFWARRAKGLHGLNWVHPYSRRSA